MLTIGIATNAYKGSMSAVTATQAIAAGLAKSRLECEVRLMPLADGGDGTLEVMLTQPGSVRHYTRVNNPIGERIDAAYGILADGITGVVELSLASGLALIGNQRNPMNASTEGVGGLIHHALNIGARRIILGVGGSATTDGGAGCLQYLGVGLFDKERNPIPSGGAGLGKLAYVEPNAALDQIEILVLCDVDNPPIGDKGAARIFAPQKGASPEQVENLEKNLTHFFTVIAEQTGNDVRNLPGGGAAGAIAGGLAALAGAKLVPGAATLIQFLDYERQLQGCDLIITGEGKLDMQTAHGKAPAVIAELAARYNIPTIAIAGSIPTDSAALEGTHLQAVFTLVPGVVTLDEAMRNGENWLMSTVQQLGNLLAVKGKSA